MASLIDLELSRDNLVEQIMATIGSPAYVVISFAYLNNWSKAEII
jgi:hypothetical protein